MSHLRSYLPLLLIPICLAALAQPLRLMAQTAEPSPAPTATGPLLPTHTV